LKTMRLFKKKIHLIKEIAHEVIHLSRILGCCEFFEFTKSQLIKAKYCQVSKNRIHYSIIAENESSHVCIKVLNKTLYRTEAIKLVNLL
jgi:hypothetical protein